MLVSDYRLNKSTKGFISSAVRKLVDNFSFINHTVNCILNFKDLRTVQIMNKPSLLKTILRRACININSRCHSSTEAVKEEGQTSAEVITTARSEREPLILSRKLDFLQKSRIPRLAWVENIDTVQEQKLGMVDLHPEIWGVMPRLDLIAENVKWQKLYKYVDYRWAPTRAEKFGGGRKPWPQKGLGKARHGSVRSPLFLHGGISHGPRGPTSYFYMLSYYARVHGLTSTLSVKLAQDDLHIVDSLEIPTDEPQYLEDLVSQRGWGISVLFIDAPDLMPRNISVACEGVKHMNLMPAYGLNVHSMLKHETLVLTTAALDHLEEKLLYALHCTDSRIKSAKFKMGQ